MSTQQQRQEWRELAAAATPGEWTYIETASKWRIESDENGLIVDAFAMDTADARFIAAARAAVPALLADVDALTAERDAANVSCKAALRDAANMRRERDALAAELERVRAQANAEWQEEHAARLVLAEQLKAAAQRAEALQADLEMEREIAYEVSIGDDL